MKRLMLLALLGLTLAASIAPAFADTHKDNMTRRCQREKC